MTRLVAFLVFAILCCNPAIACMGPQFENHHYPSCKIPLPASNERITVINGDGHTDLSDHHLGNPDRRTRLVKVHVNDNDEQNYIVLSASEQTIWKIIGDTDSISKAIVLGATGIGPKGAGVIGLPENRVYFTSPNLSELDSIPRTSCTRVYLACIPAQWFGDEPSERTSLHPEPVQPRLQLDDVVTWWSGLYEDTKQSISILRPKAPNNMVSISTEMVVSQTPAQAYELLPGLPGLKALVTSGALVPVASDETKQMVQSYAETFSARYKSRFDPNFLFNPKIDYIVTREITLPPELPSTALMVASGVPAPKMNGNRSYSVCVYLEDNAGQPVNGSGINSNLCRLNLISRAVPDDDKAILRAAASFDKMQRRSQECQMAWFDDNTHVAVLALSEGQHRRYRNDPIRQIDVDVTRDEPTVLFLSMEGGPVLWNISGPQVTAVFSRLEPPLGLAEVVLNGQPYEYFSLSSPDEDCPQFAPLWPNRLGPSIAHLDNMLEQLLRQRIDELITFTETNKDWRKPNASIPVYVID